MNRILYTLLCLLTFNIITDAQTWTGNTSTDWNTATNWSGGAVPLPAGNVTIPTAPAGNRWPVLASNVSISAFVMATGSQLNINGKTITCTTIDINGTVSNTDGASDINFILTGSGTSYVRNANFTDHVIYTINGTGAFYDSYSGSTANSYSGNVNYVRNGVGTSYIAYYSRNQYGGNVTITSTVAALLSAFEAGADITGNLNCTHVGLALTLGSQSRATNIAGTVTVNASVSGNVEIYRLINQTTGGSISLQDRAAVSIVRDTIKVNNLTITGETGALDFSNNDLTGNLSFTGAASLNGTSYVRANIVKGSASFTSNGTGTFYDTYSGAIANSYTGNVSYTRNGTGVNWISYYARNQYGAGVTINNTAASVTSGFEAGSDITGNLSVTSVGLGLTLGTQAAATNIGGTINVNASVSGNVEIYRLINQTTGGSISLQDRATTYIIKDTLKLSAININGQTAGLFFDNNNLTGNLNFTGAGTLTATSYVRNNFITGNTSYTLNGTGTFYDTYSGGTSNTYIGNTIYTRNGTGPTYVAYYAHNQYTGNVTITNTAAAILSAFEAGADITGSLSITHVGLALTLGTQTVATNITGTLNVSASVSGNVEIYRLINQTTGGNINLQDRAGVYIYKDTIKVAGFTSNGQTGALDFTNNSLTGNIDFTGAKTLSGTSYIRNNIITGNASYTFKGTGTFYDTYSGGTKNSYSGNVSYLRDSTGPLYVGYYDTVSIGGNLVFKYSLPGAVDNRYLTFQGAGNSSISQLGTIPLQFDRLSMKKTGTGKLTLMDSVTIASQVYFNGGNIESFNQKELIFSNGALSVTASNASHVVGPVVKIGAQAFSFPVGSSSAIQAVAMTVPSGTTSRYRAEYFPMSPHPTYDTSKRAAGLAAISACEYWKFDREVGTTNVTLTFDYGGPCLCVEQPANLRVVRWNTGTTQWVSEGNGAVSGGSEGTIQTGAAVSQYGIFSLGSSATVAPTVSIQRDVANPVCICRWVMFTATPVTAGCNPSYQWKKNGVNVGTNSSTYSDSTLVNGDVITVVINSSAAFAWPLTATSNSFSITTTDLTTWTGTQNTNWNNAANWSCQSVPCKFSKVTVPSTTNACEILSGNIQVISLTGNSGGIVRVLNGSTLSLKQP